MGLDMGFITTSPRQAPRKLRFRCPMAAIASCKKREPLVISHMCSQKGQNKLRNKNKAGESCIVHFGLGRVYAQK